MVNNKSKKARQSIGKATNKQVQKEGKNPQEPVQQSTSQSTIRKTYYCGVESNLACTRIVVIDPETVENQHRCWEVSKGTDLYYMSPKNTANIIGAGIEAAMRKAVGITKEEEKTRNKRKTIKKTEDWRTRGSIKRLIMVFPELERSDKHDEFLKIFEASFVNCENPICDSFEVSTEIDIVAKTHFEKHDGIVIQGGLDSYCRLVHNGQLVKNETAGFQNGPGAYWIARACIQNYVREIERAVIHSDKKPSYAKQVMKFVAEKLGLKEHDALRANEIAFSNFYKHRLAILTEQLAAFSRNEKDGGKVLGELFFDAGWALGKLAEDVTERHAEVKSGTTKFLVYGRLFDSFPLFFGGILAALSKAGFQHVQFYRKREVSAVNAAAAAAAKDNFYLIMDPMEMIYEVSLGQIVHN